MGWPEPQPSQLHNIYNLLLGQIFLCDDTVGEMGGGGGGVQDFCFRVEEGEGGGTSRNLLGGVGAEGGGEGIEGGMGRGALDTSLMIFIFVSCTFNYFTLSEI